MQAETVIERLSDLLTRHAQQPTRDVLHCATDIQDALAHWVDQASGSEPVTPVLSWLNRPLYTMMAVDIVTHEDWAPGAWELHSDGSVVASSGQEL
jgi:hypothetical protein